MLPNKIIIHHSLTEDSGTVSWGAIRHYHTAIKGWADIGYHAGIELVESGDHIHYEILLGRMWDKIGAHTIEEGQNWISLGLCFIGNYDEAPPPEGMLIIGGQLISFWMRLFKIPRSEIYGHRDFADYKTCPGKLFDIDKLKYWIPT